MKKIKLMLLGLAMLLGSSMNVFSQNQWYFGTKAGLDFTNADSNTAPVVAVNNQMTGAEGSTMAYDANGNLKIYSDGRDVWYLTGDYRTQSNHVKLTNQLTILPSSTSSTQSVMILPLNCTDYAIFTVSTFALTNGGDDLSNPISNNLYYNVIRFNSNPDSAYFVYPSHIQIQTTNPKVFFSEKLASITINSTDPNNNEFWLVAHDWTNDTLVNANTFYSFRINSNNLNGGQLTPILSKVGENHHRTGFWSAVGQMKISPNGNFIAYAMENWVEMFNFNMQSGSVTTRPKSSILLSDNNYGIEFSNDSQFLFYTNLSRTNKGIYRANINNLQAPTTIHQTGNGPGLPYGALLFNTIDGALYCGIGDNSVNSSIIYRITNATSTNPVVNTIGVINGTASASNRTMVGLPTVVQNLRGCDNCPIPNITISNIKTGFNLGRKKAEFKCLDPKQVSLTVDGLPANTLVTYTVSQNNSTIYTSNFTTSYTPGISNIVALRSNMPSGTYTVTLSWGKKCTDFKEFEICASTTQDPCQNVVLWVKNSVITTGGGDAAKTISSSGKCLPAERNIAIIRGLAPNTYATYIVIKSDGSQVMQNGNFTSQSDPNIETTIPLNALPTGNYTIQVFVKDQLCKSTTFEICSTSPKLCSETANVVFVRKQAGMPKPIIADCVDANLDYEFLVTGFTNQSPQIFYTLTKDGQTLVNNQPLQNSRVALNNAQAGTYVLSLRWADCPPFTKEIKICTPTLPDSSCSVDCCEVPSTLLDREMLFKSLSSIFFSNVNNRIATIRYMPTPDYINSIDAYKNYINSQLRSKGCAEGTLNVVFKLWKYKFAPNTVSNGEQLRDIFLNENTSKPSFELKSQITNYSLDTEFNHQLESSNSFAYVVEVSYQWSGNNNLTNCNNSAVGGFVSGVQARRGVN